MRLVRCACEPPVQGTPIESIAMSNKASQPATTAAARPRTQRRRDRREDLGGHPRAPAAARDQARRGPPGRDLRTSRAQGARGAGRLAHEQMVELSRSAAPSSPSRPSRRRRTCSRRAA
jgi:hypothetical protein